jgi:hypothetical protein
MMDGFWAAQRGMPEIVIWAKLLRRCCSEVNCARAANIFSNHVRKLFSSANPFSNEILKEQGLTLHSGTLWGRQRLAALGAKTLGARRKNCQEAGGGGGGAQAGGTAAPVVGEWRSVRTVAQ